MVFLVVSLRAVIELVFWVLVGRGVLALLAGRSASDNAMLRLFDAFLRPPRALLVRLFPGMVPFVRDVLLGALLASLWLALAVVKWWLLT